MQRFQCLDPKLFLIALVLFAFSSEVTLAQSCPSGSSPVYRFLNTSTGGHFFTISESEKDNVLARYPWFSYEGVGFCAYKSGVVDGPTAKWSVINGNVCCPSGSTTYEITIGGVTKRSIRSACGSDSTYEGFATTSAGDKSFTGRTSGPCGTVTFSGNVTMAPSACYRFTLIIDNSNKLVTNFAPVSCSTSADANLLREESQATPMAIFPMIDESSASGKGAYQAIPQR